MDAKYEEMKVLIQKVQRLVEPRMALSDVREAILDQGRRREEEKRSSSLFDEDGDDFEGMKTSSYVNQLIN